ncbi:phage integrase N-terminal SAM-like domain-containing protein [Priestia megaterium]|uniref:tyrosine-type recombinase/integrase n=1 Tax=Priestia megaterium TaxID=1404 RepID=UPI002E24712C|nr:tyrosine-type recombinase/integrase [Priestia megaterium]MED4029654.1 phage integrase N-terminal SAM-like domain-containing protein [Priestia megaterium]
MDIPLIVQRFLVHLHESGKKHSTISMYKHDLNAFFRWLNQQHPHMTPETLPEGRERYEEYFTYLKEKNLSEANLRRVASHLNGLLRFYDLIDQIGSLKATTKKQRELTDNDFISENDTRLLLDSVIRHKNLTDTQLKIHEHIAPRNQSILILMLHYGLTINEIVSLNIKDINFSQNALTITTNKGKRVLDISRDDKKIIYNYFSAIPLLFKPKDYTDDPLFLSFHPQKMVYWYDYNLNKPRRISLIGVKRMIEKEVQRSGIQAKVRSTQFRNSCILKKLLEGYSNEQTIYYFGLSSRHALYRYKRYLKSI